MRILYVTLDYPPNDRSGTATIAYEITQKLANFGAEIHVLVPGDHSEITNEKHNLYVHKQKVTNISFLGPFSIPIQVFTNWLLLHKSALKIIEKYGINLICSMDYAGYCIAGKVPTITLHMHPTIYDYVYTHSLTQKLYVMLFTLNMERIVLQKSEKIVCGSHNIKRLLERQYPFAKEKTMVVRYGINVERFKPIKNSWVREKYGISRGDVLLLQHGGGRSERKGTLYLLEALEILKQKYDVKCIITGSSREAGWNRRLLNKIVQKRLNDIILAGEVDYQDSVYYYSSADIAVFPSIFEGFGLPVFEAMACENPVICTNIADVPILLKDNKYGISVEVGNVVALANSIEKLINDSNLRQHLGKKARRFVEENLSLEATVKKLIEIYNSVLNEKR